MEGHGDQRKLTTFLDRCKIDIVIVLVFLFVAFAIRYWDYASIPKPRRDEMAEDAFALKIFQGVYPLTDRAKFMGSFFQYVLAGFYLIFGRATSTARLMVVFFGSFTVDLTYLLAKDFVESCVVSIVQTTLFFELMTYT